MDNSDDMYDEPPTDQDPREGAPPKDEGEDVGEPFLAPKSAFRGDLSPGTIHRVRVEESHDTELTLVCVGEDKAEPEAAPQAPPDENYE